jgi:hypothetical protein
MLLNSRWQYNYHFIFDTFLLADLTDETSARCSIIHGEIQTRVMAHAVRRSASIAKPSASCGHITPYQDNSVDVP